MTNNLKKLRTKAMLTQEDLASMVGTSRLYISQLETGVRDIKKLNQSTLQAICSVLECTTDQLTASTEFEYDEDNRLIVDKLYWDPKLQNRYIAKIGDEYFVLPRTTVTTRNKKITDLRPIKSISATAEEQFNYVYVMYNCVPRDGFNVDIGRAITQDELLELKKKYNISDDNISSEFIDKKGGIYGRKYMKTYTAIQICTSDFTNNPIDLEVELVKKGIEAFAVNADRVNIRVK